MFELYLNNDVQSQSPKPNRKYPEKICMEEWAKILAAVCAVCLICVIANKRFLY